MCGRFILIPKDELNRIIADVKKNLQAQQHANVSASYQDVYPKAEVPIIVPDAGRLEVAVMKWGYERSWSKVPLFNTRADTATGKKGNMWEGSLEHRRCIIPSYGFYEPHKTDTHPSPKTGKPIKDQYYFHLPNSDILLMAGVYEDGHFSIMTTEPNRWMRDIHPRMPVVLRPDEVDTWLGESYSTLFDRSNIELTAQREAA
ncbi:SOS response-associated peptidase [Ruminococcaceae bacterium OttesenSCG-928-A11]|nr:SOS response-associated peptidase [Ruminococcaceae bacterium OttesenSCG-928-A11]